MVKIFSSFKCSPYKSMAISHFASTVYFSPLIGNMMQIFIYLFIYEDYCFLSCDAIMFGRCVPTFTRTLLLPPASQMMEADGSSEMLVCTYQPTRHHTPQHSNLKSLIRKRQTLNTYLCFISQYYK